VKPRRRRPPAHTPPPPPPTVPELALAPELAAITLLEHALAIARDALVAEHLTLFDDLPGPRDQGAVVALAQVICQREAALRETLHRYRRAVRDTVAQTTDDSSDDAPF
jgi:hypothetical protein